MQWIRTKINEEAGIRKFFSKQVEVLKKGLSDLLNQAKNKFDQSQEKAEFGVRDQQVPAIGTRWPQNWQASKSLQVWDLLITSDSGTILSLTLRTTGP